MKTRTWVWLHSHQVPQTANSIATESGLMPREGVQVELGGWQRNKRLSGEMDELPLVMAALLKHYNMHFTYSMTPPCSCFK